MDALQNFLFQRYKFIGYYHLTRNMTMKFPKLYTSNKSHCTVLSYNGVYDMKTTRKSKTVQPKTARAESKMRIRRGGPPPPPAASMQCSHFITQTLHQDRKKKKKESQKHAFQKTRRRYWISQMSQRKSVKKDRKKGPTTETTTILSHTVSKVSNSCVNRRGVNDGMWQVHLIQALFA